MSDCNTPFLRSKVAESVTVLTLPDASVGSVYRTVRISPCKIQYRLAASSTLNLSRTSSPSVPLVVILPVPLVAVKLSVIGQLLLDGPSVYLMLTSISNIAASGAISTNGPNCLGPGVVLTPVPTLIVPSTVEGLPA